MKDGLDNDAEDAGFQSGEVLASEPLAGNFGKQLDLMDTTLERAEGYVQQDHSDSRGPFRCVMDNISANSCRSPFRCQQKLKLLRRMLRKSASQTACATGLEIAADYFLGSIKLQMTKKRKASKPSEPQLVIWEPSRLEKLFHSSAFLPTICSQSDWQLQNHCTFCLEGAPLVQPDFAPTFCMENSFPQTVHDLPESNSEKVAQPSTEKGGKHRKVSRGVQRKYSAAELTAAIVEVERGKVGTRKAAFLYGIPRSTLRNKMGKLTAQKSTISEASVLIPERKREKPPIGGLKRAASADLTLALKEIISRHITEKSKADDHEGDMEKYRDHSRFKRGRYRRYDKGDLEEALKVVRKGEMTVHRAGHFFGIPHSTLEYKIKERNIVSKSTTAADEETKSPSSSSCTNDDNPPKTEDSQDDLSQPFTPAMPTPHGGFTWPGGDTILPAFHFGLGQLAFPSPFYDFFNSFSHQGSFAGAGEKMVPFYTAAGKPSFIVPFRPWVPGSSSPLPSQDRDKTDTEQSPVDDFDEPLDLIIKPPAATA